MADVIVTIKLMPDSPSVNLTKLEAKTKKKIKEFIREDSEMRVEIEPVAFGLKALKITFVMSESLGSPDPLVEEIEKFDEVNSAEVIDVRRALG